MLEALSWIAVAAFGVFMAIVSFGCGVIVVMKIADEWL